MSRLILLVTLIGTLEVQSAEFIFDYSGINQDIPELNPGGFTDTRMVSQGGDLSIVDLDLTLTISGTQLGGFNGDLFVTLEHEAGYAVLLNRVGARTGFPSGYSDNGLNITFDDAISADVHTYRLTLTGDHSVPITGELSGFWSPDARDVDALLVTQDSPRTAFLSSFNGLPLDGAWSLFVSDRSAGGTHQLKGWSLMVQTIPEPTTTAIGGMCLFVLFLRRIFANSRRIL